MAETETRREVIRYVTRLIDYGKGARDDELDQLSLGQIADRIIAATLPPSRGGPVSAEQETPPEDPFSAARRRAEADAFDALTPDEQQAELTRRLRR